MSFTSAKYILFLAAVCLLYFVLPGKVRKPLLLAANYGFYALWKPAFCLLLAAGTAVTYLCGRAAQARLWNRRGLWSAIGAVYMLGILFVFKYLDFFGTAAIRIFGGGGSFSSGLLLPVGISFYTFSAVGYLFDVANGKIEAERSLLDFAVFQSFFPVILSGPIGSAETFLPQLKYPRGFSYTAMKRGLLRIAVGAVKKMVVADTLGIFVNTVYAEPASATGGVWIIAAAAYSFQIYFDFSGYSDMAIGSADILGFELRENFAMPYLARSVKEFWRRWHISLTSWFTRYLYIPLGGSRRGRLRTYLNVLAVFAVSGLWHGAAVTFIIWGLVNGAYQVVGQLMAPVRGAVCRRLHIGDKNPVRVAFSALFTFALITAAWIFFRADSVGEAIFIIKRILLIFRDGFGGQSPLAFIGARQALLCIVGVAAFMISELLREHGVRLPSLEKHAFGYWITLALMTAAVAVFGVYGDAFDPTSFVYFRF